MRVRFNTFAVDSDSRELLNGSQPVPLSPKAFQLLLYEHLWPTSFVVDANLGNLMAEVRDALDDDPRAPRFIRTVHRFGDAFCGTATEDAAGPARAAGAPPSFTLTWRGGKVSLADGTYVVGRESGVAIRIPSRRRRLTSLTAGR